MNNFDSIEKLVDFGIGISIAQQMVRMMNTTIGTMQVPQVNPVAQVAMPAPAAQLYIATPEGVAGPFTDAQLEELARAKRLTPQSLVWQNGMHAWAPATAVPQANKYLLLYP